MSQPQAIYLDVLEGSTISVQVAGFPTSLGHHRAFIFRPKASPRVVRAVFWYPAGQDALDEGALAIYTTYVTARLEKITTWHPTS